MKTSVVANQKGGVAKSTTSTHWVMYDQEQGRRVLFIDLDPQGNSSSDLIRAYGEPVGTASQMFNPDSVFDIRPLTVLRADKQELANILDKRAASVAAFKENIEKLSPHFDRCIIDTSPMVTGLMEAALSSADYVLSPLQLNQYAVDGIADMLTVIKNVKQKTNSKLAFLGMLPSIVKGNSPNQQDTLRRLQTLYPTLVLPVSVSDRQSIPEALQNGVPVWKWQKTTARIAGQELRAAFELLDKKMGVK